MASYLMDAVLQRLRSSAAAAAFGDTFNSTTDSGTQKFSADIAASPDLPYAVLTESPSSRTWMCRTAGGTPYIDHGAISLDVVASARDTVKDLAGLVVLILNDQQFSWSSPYDSGSTMRFRLSHPPSPVAVGDSAEGSPVQYLVQLMFNYESQGSV